MLETAADHLIFVAFLFWLIPGIWMTGAGVPGFFLSWRGVPLLYRARISLSKVALTSGGWVELYWKEDSEETKFLG